MPEQFPFEAVRDLLGILRLMWVHLRLRDPVPRVLLRRVEWMAQELREATVAAAAHDPGTAPYEKALKRAEGAVLRFSEVAMHADPKVSEIVELGRRRVQGERERTRANESEREQRRWALGKRR